MDVVFGEAYFIEIGDVKKYQPNSEYDRERPEMELKKSIKILPISEIEG